ncbi:MAG: glycosyltransferase family 2 protein [Desulfosporosinus sp.]|nr:glycosyltransferase family 2 protein [Desulfosporosinus sp.]
MSASKKIDHYKEKTMMRDISIIIVSWNTREILRKCLESLCNHTRNISFEIIVVDNNSSDGSPEAVEREFPQVKLIRNQENLGFAGANNIGIKAGSGRYVALVNSDIIVLGDCIRRMTEFMDENPSVGMAGPRILNPDRTLQVSCRHFPSIWNNLCQVLGFNKVFPKSALFSEPLMKYWSHDAQQKVDVLSGCFWVVRRKALDEVGSLDENFFIYGEDIDWCRRFQQSGWDVMFYPGAEAIHFGGASSSNAPIRFYLEMQRADLQYWRKHHGNLGRLAYWTIILVRQLVRMPIYACQYVFSKQRRETALFKLKRSFVCIKWLFTYKGAKA